MADGVHNSSASTAVGSYPHKICCVLGVNRATAFAYTAAVEDRCGVAHLLLDQCSRAAETRRSKFNTRETGAAHERKFTMKRMLNRICEIWKRSSKSLRPVLPDILVFVGVWISVAVLKWGPERLSGFEVPRSTFFPAAGIALAVASMYLSGAARWFPNRSPEERSAQVLHSVCLVIPSIFLMTATWMTISWARSSLAFVAQVVFSTVVYVGLVIQSRGVVDIEYEQQLWEAAARRRETRRHQRSARAWRIVSQQIRFADGRIDSPTVVSAKVRLIGTFRYLAIALPTIVMAAVVAHASSTLDAQWLRPYSGSFAVGIVCAMLLIVVKYFGRLALGGVDVTSNGLLALMYSMIYLQFALQYLTASSTGDIGPALTALFVSVGVSWLVSWLNTRVFRDGRPDPDWSWVPLAAGWSTNAGRALRVNRTDPGPPVGA